MPTVKDCAPILGCDPEFFFRSDKEVIGAEKVLPKKGMKIGSGSHIPNTIIIDGVQAELNPSPSTCRAILAGNIANSLFTLQDELKKQDKGITCDFSRAVEISKTNLMELEEDSRKFGCAPSQNIYSVKSGLKIKNIDPTEYRVRAAGGHIHLGHGEQPHLRKALIDDHKKTVQLLDILCGNTSVLIDRDEGNIERRKVYGKAGEFRQPKHGLEYRTLSNYWLTAYPLMSFAFGMARLAVCVISDPLNSETFYKEFTSKVKETNIHKAINNNDFDLAMENFLAIEELIKETAITNYGRHPINSTNMKEFHHFIAMTKKHGLEYWFKQDPMAHWISQRQNYLGFNDYLHSIVRTDMKKSSIKVA